MIRADWRSKSVLKRRQLTHRRHARILKPYTGKMTCACCKIHRNYAHLSSDLVRGPLPQSGFFNVKAQAKFSRHHGRSAQWNLVSGRPCTVFKDAKFESACRSKRSIFDNLLRESFMCAVARVFHVRAVAITDRRLR